MTAKVYRDQVDDCKNALDRTAVRIGLKSSQETWVVLPGSPKRKVSWTLMVANGDKLIPVSCIPRGYLGETAREAAATLTTTNNAWIILEGAIRRGTVRV